MGITKLIWQNYKNTVLKQPAPKKDDFIFSKKTDLVLCVTSRCNFTCRHCLRNLDEPKDLPLEVAKKALEEIKIYNYKHVCITGGEPLVYPHFKELIELVAKNGYNFSIVTNGYLINKYADFLIKYKNKIAFIGFSLESTDRKQHDSMRHKGSFDKLQEAFSFCKRQKIPFRIVTAVSTINYDQIYDIILFSKRKGAQLLALTTILPCPRSEGNNLVLSANKREELVRLLKPINKLIKFPVSIAADICANNNISICCVMEMMQITIDPEGNLVQCCELVSYGDEKVRQKAIIADLKQMSLEEALRAFSVYAHKFYAERIKDFKNQPDPQHIDFNSCFYCVKKLGGYEKKDEAEK